jgi:hypothetical protein
MKKITLLLLVTFLSFSTFAQDKNEDVPMKSGTVLNITGSDNILYHIVCDINKTAPEAKEGEQYVMLKKGEVVNITPKDVTYSFGCGF